MSEFSKGDTVEWSWGGGTGTGKVTEKFTSDVERTIKGSKITRKASKDDPAYLLEQDDGDKVLKSGSELKAAGGSSKSSSKASSNSSSKSSGGGSKGGSHDGQTKDELYEEAKSKDIEGRSDMTKDELAKALKGS